MTSELPVPLLTPMADLNLRRAALRARHRRADIIRWSSALVPTLLVMVLVTMGVVGFLVR